MPNDDLTLLRQYAAAQSETAFAELVTRYLPLVYFAAVRRTGDEHLAEEIAQAVFILLARKAGMLGPSTVLAGWLHRTTRYAAAHAVKAAPAGLAVNIASTAAISGTTLTTTAMIILHKSLLTVALLAAVGAGIYEARQAQQARVELQTLQQLQAPLAVQIQQLQTECVAATNRLASVLAHLSNTPDNSELLRLRGQVGVLQHEADDASQKARLAGQKLAELLSAKAKFAGHESALVNNVKQVGLAMFLHARDHGGQLPTDFEQLTNELGGMDKLVKMNVFEFDRVNPGAESLDASHDLRVEHPGLVVMRERLARQAPDGSWSRIYGFVDGRVVTATSYDGNFAAWEKANTYTPPANP